MPLTIHSPNPIMTHKFFLSLICSCAIATACAAESRLYSINAKDTGAPFDMTATEIKREPAKSYLSAPGFSERTAAQSRWLMCVYTDLTLKRGFSHFTVVYPPENSDVITLGFANSERAKPKQLLGKDYAPERMLGEAEEMMPVSTFSLLCGF